ncbi:cytochrome b [Occultella glacieicola]|uniref:Cytochrome b n=1 Tax=Occultella glacieicola TaxID=2518684 RepID=A0ABY2DWG0_9MICO|nr:cytochrome b/b6 domain-containing protein [Occultella glacieicola]TDE88121.1 cytochrome b [Occultella glacieicola]
MGSPGAATGYGTVAKLLHWTMVVAIAVQFVLGYSIDRFDDLLEWAADLFFGGEEDWWIVPHAVLGATILALACLRLWWRRTHGLPDWAPGLSAHERRVATVVERTLYVLMFAIPVTGLALLFATDSEWDIGPYEWAAPLPVLDDDTGLVAHVTTHIVFFVALTVHVGLVVKHQFVDRDRLLNRMV